jgi:type I restriction enzyme S subunit
MKNAQFCRADWPVVRLADVADIASGVTKGRDLENATTISVPYLRVANVQAGHLNLDEIKEIQVLPGDVEKFRLQPGDVLMTEGGDRDKLGRGTIWRGQIDCCIHQNHVFRVRTNALKLVPEYLSLFLGTPEAKAYFLSCAKQTTGIASINKTQLAELPVLVPPVGEQKRIADILHKADAIRRKRRETVLGTDSLIASEFVSRFGDPVSNSKHLSQIPLARYGSVTTGNTPPREDPANYGDAIEWIKSDNINTPFHWITRAREGLSEKGRSLARTAPKRSTLVTCIAGSRDCVGNAAMTDRTVAFNQQINAITPSPSTDAFFLYALILLSKPLIQRSSTESMKGMVSKGKFEQLHVIEVPSATQKAFGKVFDRILGSLSNLNRAEKESEDLFNSLAQRAFRGEL